MNIAILGGPGSGKGTITNKLKDEFGYKLICAGDLLREEKSSGSDLGIEISNLIDNGNLVPDSIITNIIFNEIKKPIEAGRNFLIDGYPRTVSQGVDLDRMINVQVVIWLDVSEETTIKRNLNRGLTSGRPDDLSIEVIKQRIKNYNDISLPIKQFYLNMEKVVEVDGEGSPDDVYKRVVDILFETEIIKEPRDLNDII